MHFGQRTQRALREAGLDQAAIEAAADSRGSFRFAPDPDLS